MRTAVEGKMPKKSVDIISDLLVLNAGNFRE